MSPVTREHSRSLKRFWCRREGRIRFDELGFVADPDSLPGKALNPDLHEFREIDSYRCLILLGELGIGKSHTLEALVPTVRSQIESRGDRLLFIDLRQYGNEDRLVKEVFESQAFGDWIRGDHHLYVFLDSFDECHNMIQTLPAILEHRLQSFPSLNLRRLSLRIACRTASWPTSLEETLSQLLGNDALGAFELVPLRRKDVEGIVTSQGLDHDAFLHALLSAGAVPFAVKPLTLKFLTDSFSKSGQLPSSQRELYSEACGVLCEESQAREDIRTAGRITAAERMAIAGWISTALMLGNKSAVATAGESELEEHLALEDLVTTGTSDGANVLNVTRDGIRESLATGLFTARGPGLIGPAHASYSEFLASRFLGKNIRFEQALKLIRHPSDPEGKVAPHLRGVAVWLAGMDDQVLEFLLSTDPWLLLNADVGNADEATKQQLVSRLLELSDSDSVFDLHNASDRQLRQLRHPAIANQLRERISSKDKSCKGRRFAIHIAADCGIPEMVRDLVGIALDSSDDIRLRVRNVSIGMRQISLLFRPLFRPVLAC